MYNNKFALPVKEITKECILNGGEEVLSFIEDQREAHS